MGLEKVKFLGKAYQAVTGKRGVARYVVENRPGRVLRMQDAKQAFTLGSRNYEIVHRPLQNTSGYQLVTRDAGISEKLAKMYPAKAQSYETMTTAEKIATLQKRSDCRAAFTSGAKPQSRWLAILENNQKEKLASLGNNLILKALDFQTFELPQILNKLEIDFLKRFPKIDISNKFSKI